MGSKVDAPAAPDYAPVAAADRAIADKSFQFAQDQLDWAKQQYGEISPYAFEYLDAQSQALQTNQQFAQQQLDTYNAQYAPIETEFTQRALDYNTPERAAQQSALARADVSRSIDAQRQAALTSMGSYGIDPSEMRFGALDASFRVAKALGEAQAGTQSRLNTEATQLALMGEAINIGRGYPGAISNSYNTATSAGGAGLKSASTNFAVGADAMGSPTQFLGAANVANANQAQALNLGFTNQLAGAQMEAQSAADSLYGIGNIIGGVGRTAMGLGSMGVKV